jgi:L-fucose mutarotase/ribose pyranase (RbsD/FucU family)
MEAYTKTSGDLEATLEPFGNGDEVDIISIDYPASWNDSAVLSAIDALADELHSDGLGVKNLSTWTNRLSH